MGDRWSDEKVDELLGSVTLEGGMFDYRDFTRILKHGATEKEEEKQDEKDQAQEQTQEKAKEPVEPVKPKEMPKSALKQPKKQTSEPEKPKQQRAIQLKPVSQLKKTGGGVQAKQKAFGLK